MLSDVVTEELIQLHVPAQTWEEAIRVCARPLADTGRCTPAFVDAMVETAREFGPYIVITKHVAMPHARPEEGALKTGISISTLEQPVEFGNAENDPVAYVFGLCATDATSHVEAIAELAGLLEEGEFYRVLDEAAHPSDVLAYLQKYEAAHNS